MRPLLLSLAAAGLLTAGCGEREQGSRPTAADKPANQRISALLRVPARPGEVVIHGTASPATHGPVALRGRYLVRFEQYGPENPELAFADQTSFVAALEAEGRTPGEGVVELFSATAARGRRKTTLDGRYVVNVSFGDFPYVLRFTPSA